MTDDTSNLENATSHIPETRREPPAPAKPQNPNELPWWQTIYQRPPDSFHSTPQYRAQDPVRPLVSPRRPVVPSQHRSEQPGAAGKAPPIAHRAGVPLNRPADLSRGPSTTQSKQPSQRRRKLVAIGVVVLVVEAVALMIGVLLLGTSKTTELDVNQAEHGVVQILTDSVSGYGVTNISSVRCNNGVNPPVKKDSTFKCEAIVDGRQRQVTVVFVDDDGTYEVGSPTG